MTRFENRNARRAGGKGAGRRLVFSFVAFTAGFAAFLFPAAARAQYIYGKNKVIYDARDWKVMETEHVDIYHYPDEANLVRYVAPLAEETFLEYEERFDLEFERRLPFVFYSSHYDFQQTNILPQLISEYTGGFTDLMKGRIAVPYTGSYGTFRHVARHEMVHAFMLEKLRRVMNQAGKLTYPPPPLWFIEGMAEYFATSPQDAKSRMFVRDALLHDHLLPLPEIWRIEGSFMMYKEGEAVVNYIAVTLGEEAVIQILENWWMSNNFSIVLKKTIDMDLEELSDAFLQYTKRRHYPSLLQGAFPSDIGEQITPHNAFHTRPALTIDVDGNMELYSLCAEDGVINVCRVDSGGKNRLERTLIAKGSRSETLESIPAFRSKIEAHGDTLVFVSKSGDQDVIYFWDAKKRRRIDEVSIAGLSLLSSPTLSGDRSRMVFSAIDSVGIMDLFLYELETRRSRRITDDSFSEEDPDFHPTENWVLFTSDRAAGGRRDRTAIYRMNLDTGEITAMTGGDHSDSYPEWAPDGKSFLFTSDRDGTYDIYQHRGEVLVRQTNVLGGANMPAFAPDGRSFVASVYDDGAFILVEFPVREGDETPAVAATSEATTATGPDFRGMDGAGAVYPTRDYKVEWGIDLVAAGVSLNPEFGEFGNGAQMMLTDMLGDHHLYFLMGNTSEGLDDFWRRLNVAGAYFNQGQRLNYSIGVFHLNNIREDPISFAISERRYGGALGVSFPLDKFRRIDGSLVLQNLERDFGYYIRDARESTFMGTLYASYVSDKTLWTIGGPLTGWRYYVRGGQTIDFLGRGFSSTSLHVDVRKYLKLLPRVVFAGCFHVNSSWGSDRQVFYLGGPWDLRGYRFREFIGQTTYLLNSELRFPLIDRLALSFPFGTLEMPMFRGSVFFDLGRATRFIFDTGWLGSFGWGIELNLGYAPVVRVNWTRKTDFRRISDNTVWELFIGYNY